MNLDTIRADLVPVADLTYGKTPWDQLDREQLIYLLQSYHRVVQSVHNLFKNCPDMRASVNAHWRRCFDETETAANYIYSAWNADMQAAADEMGTEIAWGGTETPTFPEESEQLWRCTMRPMSSHLAFDHRDDKWQICGRCGIMLSPGPSASRSFPNCSKGSEVSPCTDMFRPFTWDVFRNPPTDEGEA